MTGSNLMLHKGARLVTRAELDAVPAPPATATWFPLRHAHVLDRVTQTLAEAGFETRNTRMALSPNNARFFGTLDLNAPIVSGVDLCVGVRNSIDKSFPIAFCAGHRVFVCDNLAFRSEITVARKHTRNGESRFVEAISHAVQSLHEFRETEATRIRTFEMTDISDERASHLILRAFEERIISHLLLPQIIQEWRKPSFEEFEQRTLWSLFNAFTGVLRTRQTTSPQQMAALTIRLQHLLDGTLHPAETELCAMAA